VIDLRLLKQARRLNDSRPELGDSVGELAVLHGPLADLAQLGEAPGQRRVEFPLDAPRGRAREAR
jgi:hypothetical protein